MQIVKLVNGMSRDDQIKRKGYTSVLFQNEVNPFTPGRALWPNDTTVKDNFSGGRAKYWKCSDSSFLK